MSPYIFPPGKILHVPADVRPFLRVGKMNSPAPLVSLEHLGQLIRATRKAQGLRLADAAGLCGVSMRFLSELENGRDTCSMRRVMQVCQTLGIDLYAQRREGGGI